MNTSELRFGTDGWRGVIAEDFTFENLRRVARAIALYAREKSPAPPLLTVGYDTRFLSAAFAGECSRVLKECGCRIILSSTGVSTPCLSSSVVDNRAFGGIMISASHNPPRFNGVKFKISSGASSPGEVTKRFESLIDVPGSPHPGGSVETASFIEGYFKRLASFVDFDSIKRSGLKCVADPMYGAGRGYLQALLRRTNCTVIGIHETPDPLFGGLHPEPIERYLGDLKKAVRMNGACAGLATDGDADRIGVIDDRGRYLTPHQVFSLLLYYLCRFKGLKGKVVQALSLGYVSERIAKDFNLDFEEVPIGFKYIAERIQKEKVLIGGEESGGYGYGGYLPERDGILNSLMILEMLAQTGRPLSSLLREIEKKYGASFYLRTDFVNPGVEKSQFVSRLKERCPKTIKSLKVKQVKDLDGVEFVLEDDSWLLLRPSGTEPIIRVYAESSRHDSARALIEWGQKIAASL